MKMQPPRALMFGLSMAALALAMPSPRAQETKAVEAAEPAQGYDHTATQTITPRDGASLGATLHISPEQNMPEQAAPSLDAPGPALIEAPAPSLPANVETETPAREATTIAEAMKQALDALAKEPARNIAATEAVSSNSTASAPSTRSASVARPASLDRSSARDRFDVLRK